MGQAKWAMMEEEERGFTTPPKKLVGSGMFPFQRDLKDSIVRRREVANCSYSGKTDYVMPLEKVIEIVLEAMEQVFENPANSLPFDSHGDDWDGTGLHIEGAGYVVPDGYTIMTTQEALLDVGFEPESEELLDDICAHIINSDWVYKDVIITPDDKRLKFNWGIFWKETVKAVRAGKTYDEIVSSNAQYLKFMLDALTKNRHSLVKTLPKGTKLYRCVNYSLPLPDLNDPRYFWAPPHDKASSQRMSRKGQSRFYASFDRETPLKEAVINTPGETKCLSTFELTQDVKIFDFHNLPEARLLNCPDVLAYRFFNAFADDITKPIDNDKTLYVPTQIVRDVIEDHFMKTYGVMGLTYRSVKGTAPTSKNIVMFLDNDTCAAYLSKLDTAVI